MHIRGETHPHSEAFTHTHCTRTHMHAHAHINLCGCLSWGVFKQQLKSSVAGSQRDNGSYLEMSCSCKTVIILINYLLGASTHSSAYTQTLAECEHTAGVSVCSEQCCFCAYSFVTPCSQPFLLVWISRHIDPSHLRYSCQVVCDSLSHLLLCCQARGNACLTLWFEFFNYMRCVWFTSVHILQASKLGQHLHSLPCPCVLLFVFFRYAKFLKLIFSQDLLFHHWPLFSLLHHLPRNISSSFFFFISVFLLN